LPAGCDTLFLLVFEEQRAETARSSEWKARQMRKFDGDFQERQSFKDAVPVRQKIIDNIV
jgi:hypothetical protein